MGDPIQSKRVEQLLNSVIKNRINKQEIAGGPVVQVSNFGTSRQLQIKFKDKNGSLLKTREEYEREQQTNIQRVLSRSDETIAQAKRAVMGRDGRAIQESKLENWAKSKGIWHEGEVTKDLEQKYGKKIGNGGESWVFRKDEHTVIKAKDNIYDDAYSALESIQIHNTLFPSTKITLVGIGRSDGELTFILEQPDVHGRAATKEEISNFIKENLKGSKDESVVGDNSYQNDLYKLQDLKPANVLVDTDGNIQVIDGDFYLKNEESSSISYEDYLKENQGGIAYFEAFVPIYANNLFTQFADKDGNIDIKAIEQLDPDFLKLAG